MGSSGVETAFDDEKFNWTVLSQSEKILTAELKSTERIHKEFFIKSNYCWESCEYTTLFERREPLKIK